VRWSLLLWPLVGLLTLVTAIGIFIILGVAFRWAVGGFTGRRGRDHWLPDVMTGCGVVVALVLLGVLGGLVVGSLMGPG